MLTPVRSQSSWATSLGAPGAVVRRRARRLARSLVKLALVVSMAGLIAGCTAPGLVDNADSSVIFQVEEVVLTSNPWGDVLTTGGTILDDVADVTLTAVLKAPISTVPGLTTPDLQNIILERYEVTYTRTDGGTSVPPGFTRGIGGMVRLTAINSDEVEGFTLENLVIVPSTIKAQPPISFLISPGTEPDTNFANIQVNARVQFFGRTVAGFPVTVVTFIGVNFANYGDDNS